MTTTRAEAATASARAARRARQWSMSRALRWASRSMARTVTGPWDSVLITDGLPEGLGGDGKLGDVDAEGVGGRIGQHGVGAQGPALPHAPHAEGVVGGMFVVADDDVGDLGRRGHQVVHQGAGDEVAGFVVDEMLVEGAADPLGDGAGDLAVDDLGVQGPARVLDAYQPEDPQFSGIGVD